MKKQKLPMLITQVHKSPILKCNQNIWV